MTKQNSSGSSGKATEQKTTPAICKATVKRDAHDDIPWWPNAEPPIAERKDLLVAVLNSMSSTNWKTHCKGLLLMMEHNAAELKVLELLREMSQARWTEKRDAALETLGAPMQKVVGVLHTAHGDLDVAGWPESDPMEPDGWKPELADAHTSFVMGEYGGHRMSKLEAMLWHGIGGEIEGFIIDYIHDRLPEPPSGVQANTWEAARKGEAAALRAANRCNPGCIYRDFRVFMHIRYHTVIAARSIDADQAFESREWLKSALLPFVSNSRRGGRKDTPRAEMGMPHLQVFWQVFRDICMVREVARSRPSSTGTDIRKLLAVFPELEKLDGKTMTEADRLSWRNLVAGCMLKKATGLEILDPRKTALRIVADITGYKSRHVYQRLIEINGGDLKCSLSHLRNEAKSCAGKLLRRPSR